MNPIDISSVTQKIADIVESHRLSDGSYCRYLGDGEPNPYGCADAANILYSIGRFPQFPEERAAFVRVLRSMQDPETGLFNEKTHHPIHTTAHCMAALELFDVMPTYRAYSLEQYLEPTKMVEFLDSLGWVKQPWIESHKGAGLYVALNLGGSKGTDEFNRHYFSWLWDNADPDTGFWKKGAQDGTAPLVHHMAGSFHYLFNHEYAHMPLRYPGKVIDSCIEIWDNNSWKDFARQMGFVDIDWVFCMTRAHQQTSHRWDEVENCLEQAAVRMADMWLGSSIENIKNYNDLHAVFGSVCCLAELQRALRGKLITDKPLKLVLDRRPFI